MKIWWCLCGSVWWVVQVGETPA